MKLPQFLFTVPFICIVRNKQYGIALNVIEGLIRYGSIEIHNFQDRVEPRKSGVRTFSYRCLEDGTELYCLE